MLSARRSQPTPVDFQYGLAEFSIPMLSLEPHLKPPIPRHKTQIVLEALPAEDLTSNDITKLIGNDLSGDSDKLHMPHIPRRFPSFPSKHTYKWTEKESTREKDPRKVREEAAKAARQGEDALRRLTKVAKAGQEKDIKNAASKDTKSKQRHHMWEDTMKDLLAGTPETAKLGNTTKEADRSLIVNADRSYCRKGPPAKRKAPPPDLLLAMTKT
jgi:transcription initiation factor TFIID subunit 8